MDGYSEKGSCSAQMKCPHCGEMMSLMAEAPHDDEGKEKMDGGDSKDWSDQEFREAMSPRNDEQPT